MTSSFSELWTPVDESRPELLVLQAGRSRQPVRYEVIVRVAPSEGGTVTVKPSAFDAKEIQRLALLRLQAGYAQTADIAVVIDAARPEGYKTASVQCRILEINPDYMVIVFQDPEAVRRLGPIEPADESGYVLVRPMRVRDEHPVWRAVITPVEVTTPWRDRLANRLTLVAGTPLTLIGCRLSGDVTNLVTIARSRRILRKRPASSATRREAHAISSVASTSRRAGGRALTRVRQHLGGTRSS